MGLYQVLPLYVRMDLPTMAIKRYSTFPEAPGLKRHRSNGLVSYQGHSLGRSYPSADIQSAYSSLSRLGCDMTMPKLLV